MFIEYCRMYNYHCNGCYDRICRTFQEWLQELIPQYLFDYIVYNGFLFIVIAEIYSFVSLLGLKYENVHRLVRIRSPLVIHKHVWNTYEIRIVDSAFSWAILVFCHICYCRDYGKFGLVAFISLMATIKSIIINSSLGSNSSLVLIMNLGLSALFSGCTTSTPYMYSWHKSWHPVHRSQTWGGQRICPTLLKWYSSPIPIGVMRPVKEASVLSSLACCFVHTYKYSWFRQNVFVPLVFRVFMDLLIKTKRKHLNYELQIAYKFNVTYTFAIIMLVITLSSHGFYVGSEPDSV